MKTIFALCGIILLAGGWFYYQSTRLPDKSGVFTGAPRVSVAELTAKPKAYMKKTVSVEGIVTEQCTTMGCYFFFHEGKDVLRVDLQDIAMNAPRKNGHPVLVEGQMVKYGDGYQLWASAVEFK